MPVNLKIANKNRVVRVAPLPADPVEVEPGLAVDILFTAYNRLDAPVTNYQVASSNATVAKVSKIAGGIRITGDVNEGTCDIIIS